MVNFLRRKPFSVYLLWFIILAVVFTWPLCLHSLHEVAGNIGDNIYFVWMVGWLQKALFELKTNPLDVSFLNYPEGWNMARTEMAPAQLVLALPFSLIGGETFGYNMALLMSFILSGLIMCYWVRHLTGSNIAGLISGTIFACLPYRQAHLLIGHLNLSGTQWIPLFFWGWFDLLKPGLNEFRKKAAVLAALGLGLTALCSQYYFFMLCIIAAVQGVVLFLFNERNRFKDRETWQSFGLFILLALPFLAAAELPFLTLAGSGGMPDRDWGSARMYSAGLTDFLLPGTMHFAFGEWVGSHFNREIWNEATLYVGLISLGLMIYGLLRKERKDAWVWQVILSGTIVGLILAMGTDLHWNGAPVELTIPTFLQEKTGRETVPIVLPGLFLFKYFPFYGKLRAMMRFGLFPLILIACGAGYGFTALHNRIKKQRRWIVTVLTLGLVLFEFLPEPITRFSEVKARPVDEWLAEQPDDGSVMRIPFYLNDDQAGTYYTLYNEKPFIGGFFNAFPPPQYDSIKSVMGTFPSDESLAKAYELGVAYYLVETDEIKAAIQRNEGEVSWNSLEELLAACEVNGLVRVGTFENVIVYQMEEEDCGECKWLKDYLRK
ncbi:MAG: hypothetical protein AB9907_12405 [Flexilinea sp.]